MFRRSLAGVALFIGLGTASLSHALSLGELSLNSALNEPFQAQIPLKDAASLSEEQITVKIASVDDFEKSGVDYNYLLSNLIFKVTVTGKGDGIVQVSSREPIVEPYLNFLIEARWPAGRMLREYTVLLDLPVVSNAKTSTVSAAQGGSATQAAREVPASREQVVILDETLESAGGPAGPKKRAEGERTNLPKSERPTEYRVQHNDMLWNLATEFKPEGVSVHQTMLALLRKNPRAFIGDNINRLKSGYVLRLPTAEEARRLGQDDALKEVRRQNAVWRGEALPSDGEIEASPQLDATGKVDRTEAGAAKKPEARLSIATPGQSDSEGAGKSGASQAMRDQLAAAQEEADRTARENAELNSRLGDLERQLATLQRLLELKDDQLATLQGQMGAEAPKKAAPPQVEQPEQAAPVADDGGFLDNPLIRYGLIALALLVLLVLILRRFSQTKTEAAFDSAHFDSEEADRNNEPSFGYDDDQNDDDEGHTTVIIEPQKRNDTSAASEEQDTEFENLDDLLADDDEADSEDKGVSAQPAAPVEAETDDALAEAEIYVAYGRYEQAAQMLSGAIAKEPKRSDLRVKLLGVYLETRDQANFMREFDALEALGDSAAISEVKEAMSAVEGVSDWLRSADATTASHDSDFGDLDFNLDEPSETPQAPTSEDNAFDLDLEEEGGVLDLTPTSTVADTQERARGEDLAASELADDEFSLDLEKSEADEEALDEISFGDLSLDDDAESSSDLSFSSLEDDDDLDLSSFALGEDEKPEAGLNEELGSTPADADVAAKPEDKPAAASDGGFDLDLDDDFNLDDLELVSAASEVDEDTADDLGELSLDDLELDKPKLNPELKKEDVSDTLIASPEPSVSESANDEILGDLTLDDEFGLDDELSLDETASPSTSGSDEIAELDDDDMSDDLGLLGDSDEVATKLDLARAYIDMGDAEGAKDMLQEVLEEGTDEQKQDANELLGRL